MVRADERALALSEDGTARSYLFASSRLARPAAATFSHLARAPAGTAATRGQSQRHDPPAAARGVPTSPPPPPPRDMDTAAERGVVGGARSDSAGSRGSSFWWWLLYTLAVVATTAAVVLGAVFAGQGPLSAEAVAARAARREASLINPRKDHPSAQSFASVGGPASPRHRSPGFGD